MVYLEEYARQMIGQKVLHSEEVEKIVDWELSEQVRLQKTEDFKAGIAASLTREVPRFNRK